MCEALLFSIDLRKNRGGYDCHYLRNCTVLDHHIFGTALKALGFISTIGLAFFILKKSEEPVKLAIKAVLTVPFTIFCFNTALKMGPDGLFVIIVGAFFVGVIWTPHISDLISGPLMGLMGGGNDKPEDKPFYSIANAKRKRGLCQEAIIETRKQLQRFPNDFEGVLLLASIQAEDMKDLAAAENTLNQFCKQSEASENHVAAAWTAMADWYLEYGGDASSALMLFQKIIMRYPGSKLALDAEQRIAHLGGTAKVLSEQGDQQNIPVPIGVDNIGLLDATNFLAPQEIEPNRLAAEYVRHLDAHPHDSEAREKLAMIYARDFKRLDLASLELMQLINEPRYSTKQIVKWINLLADFQIDLGADIVTVRETLEIIVQRFPDSAGAELAQRRLTLITFEFKGKKTTPKIKLGVYEQNIGLKYGSPRR
jgi:hypothetical protein